MSNKTMSTSMSFSDLCISFYNSNKRNSHKRQIETRSMAKREQEMTKKLNHIIACFVCLLSYVLVVRFMFSSSMIESSEGGVSAANCNVLYHQLLSQDNQPRDISTVLEGLIAISNLQKSIESIQSCYQSTQNRLLTSNSQS